MNSQDVLNLIKRDAASIYQEESLLEKLKSGRRLKIKFGADPSRPDLHLGHSVVLRKFRLLQELGHEIIFVIGDFTGMIGDPSGKSKTRVPLTFEQTRQNAQSYLQQVTKILDKNKTTVTFNSEWLSKLNFADVLSLAGKYTLARMMERDDFAKRYAQNQPIGIHEMLYPLMQGYDSVALHADIEIGGTDQTFNLLVGRELQRDYGQIPQDVITFPLLIGLDGVEKMSKSLDNYIGINEVPGIMFEKCMRVSDLLLSDYFRLTTDLDVNDYEPLIAKDIRSAHFLYANTVVGMYHNQENVADAQKRYMSISSGGLPENIETLIWAKEPVCITDLLKNAGLAVSSSEARRLIQGHGIKINDETVTDIYLTINHFDDLIVRRGKTRL